MYSHSGNQRFQDVVREELFNYSRAPSKTEKSFILAKILHQVRRWSKERIGFVKHDSKTGRWHAPRDAVARVTVAQAFRDALSNRYSSSKHNKQRKRQIAKGYVSPDDLEEEETPAYAAASTMQAPALSLKSVVHQGMIRRASMGFNNSSPQDTMAQIRNLMASNNSWNNIPSFPAGANVGMSMMTSMMPPLSNSMGAMQMQMNCRPFDMAGHLQSTMNLAQQLPPISDLEPLPIHEENQQQQGSRSARVKAVVEDAFLASEQTSAFFLGAGGTPSYSMQ